MSSNELHPVPDRVKRGSKSKIQSLDDWRREWLVSHNDPDAFWLKETTANILWKKEPTHGLEGTYFSITDGPLSWFGDGTLNITESCIDRHQEDRADKTAILWEGDEPGDVRTLSYQELLEQVNLAAGALRKLGVKKGERVVIYMGMVPEAAIAMLACARIGAIHSVVFGGFSADALRDRVRDCDAELVITQDEGLRGGRTVPLKATADEACEGEKGVKKMLVFRRTGADVSWDSDRDVWWHDALADASPLNEAVEMAAEDPLFILYTSGSTGKPKGVVHTCGGYITYAAYTHRTVFDLRERDIYACVADIGWITGHTYIVYGPLANGATTFMFESTPTYPDEGRYWDMVERHSINVFYTAPTAIRTLAAAGDDNVTKYDRGSLRVLGTVGEPINAEAWEWYFKVVGEERCTIVDTWWQTETGGIAITAIASATPTIPGVASLPMPGIFPAVVDAHSHEQRGPTEGELCITHSWPGQARTVWGDHARFVGTYFSKHPGLYFTGDGCERDGRGYYRITGRVDDVLNVSGHRLGTAEVESALLTVEEIAEAGVVGFPHPVKGQGVYAYVVLQPGADDNTSTIEKAIKDALSAAIGRWATVDLFQIVPGLPKTRSGKVMRRILRKVAAGQADELGDTSTLAEPAVVEAIVAGAKTLP